MQVVKVQHNDEVKYYLTKYDRQTMLKFIDQQQKIYQEAAQITVCYISGGTDKTEVNENVFNALRECAKQIFIYT